MDKSKTIEYYLNKKLKNELSISEIRKELIEVKGFSEEDAKQISREVSDRELEAVRKKKVSFGSIVNHKGFSYLMILISLGICGYSIIKLQKVIRLSDQYEIPLHYYFIPALFILASIAFTVKHILKLRKG